MVILYSFVCEHGKRCNFISDCPECAKDEIQQLLNRVAELEEIVADRTKDIIETDKRTKGLEADARRYEWILDNCTTVGGGHGSQVSFFVPIDHEDLSCAISIAMENKNDNS